MNLRHASIAIFSVVIAMAWLASYYLWLHPAKPMPSMASQVEQEKKSPSLPRPPQPVQAQELPHPELTQPDSLILPGSSRMLTLHVVDAITNEPLEHFDVAVAATAGEGSVPIAHTLPSLDELQWQPVSDARGVYQYHANNETEVFLYLCVRAEGFLPTAQLSKTPQAPPGLYRDSDGTYYEKGPGANRPGRRSPKPYDPAAPWTPPDETHILRLFRSMSVEGSVLTSKNQPVVGATIEITVLSAAESPTNSLLVHGGSTARLRDTESHVDIALVPSELQCDGISAPPLGDQHTQENKLACISDVQGRFRFTGINFPVVNIEATKSGHLATSVSLYLHDKAATPLTLTLNPAGIVAGTVRAGGIPVADCEMTATSDLQSSTPLTAAHTGQQGEYVLEGLPYETLFILGRIPKSELFPRGKYVWKQVKIQSGQRLTVDFDVDDHFEEGTLSGIVSIDGAVPATGDIQVISNAEAAGQTRRASIDPATGYYEFSELPFGMATILVHATGAANTKAEETQQVAIASTSVTLDIPLTSMRPVSGRVVGFPGVGRTEVVVLSGDYEIPEWTPEALGELQPQIVAQVAVTPDGAFELGDLPTGTYTIVAVAQRGNLQSLESGSDQLYGGGVVVVIEPGDPQDVVLEVPIAPILQK